MPQSLPLEHASEARARRYAQVPVWAAARACLPDQTTREFAPQRLPAFPLSAPV